MPRYPVSESAIIQAPPAKVYAILSDYRQHHPRILPPKYFRNLQVLEGGVGAGTKTKFEVRVLGTRREIVHVIAEPEPGRVLTESDPEGVSTTRFTMDPLQGGTATHLTIGTELVSREGAAGALERWMTAMMLRRIYRAELARIEGYAPSAKV